ncbi:hypothetical protein FOMA001_g17636 [Fusarium oxysporum f. sp. matthiolae]|nr:hypothetical protein FOMA001_g17636 [Fusarium oxysporum f. sp. matthiolae]
MLPDATIDRAAHKLAEFRRDNTLNELLDQYAVLIEDYKRLKSDYEEEREGESDINNLLVVRSATLCISCCRRRWIHFDERFVKDGEEGGSRAAKQLYDTIKDSLRCKGLETCEVMVRVYANLTGLSKALCKNGLAGAEKRSLSSFTTGFNRSYGLADFIDAGELKENADFKLKAILRLYADNAQCKHIYFAACHDVGYVSDLTPFREIANDSRFFGLPELPGVFRHTPLTYAYSTQIKTSLAPFSTDISKASLAYINSTSNKGAANDGNAVCQFYAQGNCRYGNTCKFAHGGSKASSQNSTPSPSTNSNGNTTDRAFSSDWRNGSTLCNGPKLNIHLLPKKEDIPEGQVAINAVEDRLDAYLPPPDPDAVKRLKILSQEKKFCNNAQLYNSCENDNCEYEHAPIAEDLKPALEHLARSVPCSRRGTCRRVNCVHGHVCQKADCRHRVGGKGYCRFPPRVCTANYAVSTFVPSNDPPLMSPSMDSDDACTVENRGTQLWEMD